MNIGSKSLKISTKGTPKPINVSVGSKKKEDAVYDLEQQFLLRLPPGPAMALKHDVESAAMNLKDRLSIEIQSDMRHGRVTYGGYVFNAKLFDLPCIVESLKTLDRKSFYKTADICQILRCTTDDDSDGQEEHDSPKKREKEKEKKYQWNHGISPCMKNVRKRRFRKTLKKKYQEQPDIEKEVKRLFRMDNEAIDVKWEEVIEENKPTDADGENKQVLAQGGISAEMDSLPDNSQMMNEMLGDDLFGELSSFDEEEEDEKDINIMDSGDEEAAAAALSQLDASLLAMSDTNMSTDGQEGELQLKLEELERHLEEIRERRMAEELELALVEDPEQKESKQQMLDDLLAQENSKQNEYEILSSMLNQG